MSPHSLFPHGLVFHYPVNIFNPFYSQTSAGETCQDLTVAEKRKHGDVTSFGHPWGVWAVSMADEGCPHVTLPAPSRKPSNALSPKEPDGSLFSQHGEPNPPSQEMSPKGGEMPPQLTSHQVMGWRSHWLFPGRQRGRAVLCSARPPGRTRVCSRISLLPSSAGLVLAVSSWKRSHSSSELPR